MRKATKIALVLASICIVIGIAFACAAWIAAEFSWENFNPVEMKSGTFEITDDFTSIDIDVLSENVKFFPAEDGVCKVVYRSSAEVNATVRDGALVIESFREEIFPFSIGSWETPYMNLYLPRKSYKTLSIKTESGDVYVFPVFSEVQHAVFDCASGDINFIGTISESLIAKTISGNILIREPNAKTVRTVSTSGDIWLSGVHATEISVESTSGDIKFDTVTAKEKLTAETTSGDIELYCDAGALFLKTVSGDVEGTLGSAKQYVTKTTSGTVRVPPSDKSAGVCEITTTSGDIRIKESENWDAYLAD